MAGAQLHGGCWNGDAELIMDWDTAKPLIDIGLGAIALTLYWRQGKFLSKFAESFEKHAQEDKARSDRQEARDIAQDARLVKLEKRKKR